MIVKTFGSQDQDTLLLLHGGGLSWWSYQKAAALFAAQHYHVVLPILDGVGMDMRGVIPLFRLLNKMPPESLHILTRIFMDISK